MRSDKPDKETNRFKVGQFLDGSVSLADGGGQSTLQLHRLVVHFVDALLPLAALRP